MTDRQLTDAEKIEGYTLILAEKYQLADRITQLETTIQTENETLRTALAIIAENQTPDPQRTAQNAFVDLADTTP